jgi:hypothetical protein
MLLFRYLALINCAWPRRGVKHRGVTTGLHSLNGITFCGGHGLLVGKRLSLPLYDELGGAVQDNYFEHFGIRSAPIDGSHFDRLWSTIGVTVFSHAALLISLPS